MELWSTKPIALMETMHEPVPRDAGAVATVGRVPVPTATIEPAAVMTDALRQQYVALCTELGVTQPGLVVDAALAYFKQRGTRLYDRAKVEAFLTDQYGPPRRATTWQRDNYGLETIAAWGWRPLRDRDNTDATFSGVMIVSGQPVRSSPLTWNPSKNGQGLGGTYTKPIPYPVLLTVKEVAHAFPAARFAVSDEVKSEDLRRVDDPFLMVTINDHAFIIERWDEPAYRE